MTIRFSEEDVRAMGRDAAGVRGMAMRSDDEVVAADIARDDTSILMVTSAGYGKRTQLYHFHRQNRGGLGVRGHQADHQAGTGGVRLHCRASTTRSWSSPRPAWWCGWPPGRFRAKVGMRQEYGW